MEALTSLSGISTEEFKAHGDVAIVGGSPGVFDEPEELQGLLEASDSDSKTT